jgi:methylglyoxal/glyoxal reductase|tara:strand:- start:88 stop:954 length:867 start_codon:yes stop_codon:yes gene_type:complete
MEERLSTDTKITLRNGIKIPIFGLGTWLSSNNGEAASAVTIALDTGYKMIDTAQMYGNESDLGLSINDWCCQYPNKERPFVVTKLKGDAHEQGSVTRALRRSLDLLRMEYVDLFLIHSPKGGRCVDTWKEMIECKKAGLVKTIGVSNFGVAQLEGLKAAGLELPEVNQIELHPWLQQKKTREYMKENEIASMGYCPLARCKQFGKTELAKLAEARSVPEALLAIRWSLEEDIITIPKSSNSQRIAENASVFNLDPLTEEERIAIAACDVGFKASNSVNSMDIPWSEVC